MVSRSSAAGNSSMPPMANSVSGNTSVCMMPALVASFSATLPATADACGVNASRPPALRLGVRGAGMRRSAISRMPRTPTSRMVPCRNSAGASTATAPITAVRPTLPCRSRASATTATNAATSPPRLSTTERRSAAARGRNASTSTPTTATPNTISMGDSSPYSTLGVGSFIFARSFRHLRCRVRLVDRGQRVADGGIDHVERQFGIHAEHQQQRDQRCDDRRSRAAPGRAAARCRRRPGRVIIRWYIHRM